MPGTRVRAVMPQREEAWLGYTYYFNGHRIKLQSALVHAWQNGIIGPDVIGNRWGMILQMELGI
jgi:phosphate-selective porin OprO and OprP